MREAHRTSARPTSSGSRCGRVAYPQEARMTNDAPTKAHPQKLIQFVSSAFQRAAMPAGDADLAAAILVDADLRGIDSHGVMNLEGYIQGLRAGTINPRADIKISAGSPTTASVDGDNGLGLVVSHRAMEECLRMAKVYGTGWAAACNSNHSGAGAYYVLMAAQQGMIGI